MSDAAASTRRAAISCARFPSSNSGAENEPRNAIDDRPLGYARNRRLSKSGQARRHVSQCYLRSAGGAKDSLSGMLGNLGGLVGGGGVGSLLNGGIGELLEHFKQN